MVISWILSIYLAFNKQFKKIQRMHQTKATHRKLYSRSEQAHPPSHSTIRTNISKHTHTYRLSQEECEILQESVPYVKLYRYNPKHLYPKLNGYGDNGQRKVWTSCISAYCTSTTVSPLTLQPHLPVDTWLREARTLASFKANKPRPTR